MEVEPPGQARGTFVDRPVGRNLSEAVFCFAVALSARLRSNTLFAFLPAKGRGFLRRRVSGWTLGSAISLSTSAKSVDCAQHVGMVRGQMCRADPPSNSQGRATRSLRQAQQGLVG